MRRLSADSSEPAIPTLTLQLKQAYVSKHRQVAGVCVCVQKWRMRKRGSNELGEGDKGAPHTHTHTHAHTYCFFLPLYGLCLPR